MRNDINLIPDKILYRRKRFFKKLLKLFLYTVLVLAVIAGLLIRPYQWIELKGKVNDITKKVDSRRLNEISAAEVKLEQKRKENLDLTELIKSIPQDKTKSTELLKNITTLMPVSITADGFSYVRSDGEIKLDLKANIKADISLFLKRLYNDPAYTVVNISAISGATNQFRFSVLLKLKQ